MLVLIVWIIILGLIVGAVYSIAPIPAAFKTLIYVICAILAIWLTLNFFGVNLGTMPHRN